MSVWDVFRKLFGWVSTAFTGERLKKAEDIAEKIVDLTVWALPYVKIVTEVATPGNPIDDLIVLAAEKTGKKLQDILHEPNEEIRRGLLLSLAAATLREALKGHLPVILGGKPINTENDLSSIHNDLFRSAAQNAFTIQRHSGD